MSRPEDAEDRVVETIELAASPERVFRALTDPGELAAWWGDPRMYVTERWELELRVGGRWRCTGRGAQGGLFEVEGEYLELDPPRVVAFTWRPSWVDVPPTVVRIVLEPTPSGTRLTWTHSGFVGYPRALADHRFGLPAVLGWLRAFLERPERPAESRRPS